MDSAHFLVLFPSFLCIQNQWQTTRCMRARVYSKRHGMAEDSARRRLNHITFDRHSLVNQLNHHTFSSPSQSHIAIWASRMHVLKHRSEIQYRNPSSVNPVRYTSRCYVIQWLTNGRGIAEIYTYTWCMKYRRDTINAHMCCMHKSIHACNIYGYVGEYVVAVAYATAHYTRTIQ